MYIGEAAGFQDCLFGFGLKYALSSGHLAARSIIRKEDYDRLWKESFQRKMKSSLLSRYGFEKLGNKGYERSIDRLRIYLKHNNSLDRFRSLYDFSLSKRLLYPLASFSLRHRLDRFG